MFFAIIANDIVILTMFACHTDYLIEGAHNKETFKNVSRYFAVSVPSKTTLLSNEQRNAKVAEMVFVPSKTTLLSNASFRPKGTALVFVPSKTTLLSNNNGAAKGPLAVFVPSKTTLLSNMG